MYLTVDGSAIEVVNGQSAPLGNAQLFKLYKTKYKKPQIGVLIEVDLSKQVLWYKKDGKVLLRSKIVSGRPSMKTPKGKFKVINKARNVNFDLGGSSSYWMAFTYRGHGFHDATWQSSFGGTRWKTNGSHGCVNMPLSKAKKLYSLVRVGNAVWVHS
jgi:lipoprotein-anchoring transpeptidase ErfK/SrfK